MEKLIVKNFGPIKKAEIELTKCVVFIGDTSTGKSVLSKLIAIFRDALLSLSLKEANSISFKEELKKYNIDFNIDKTKVSYFEGKKKLLELQGNEIVLIDVQTKLVNLKRYEIVLNELDNRYRSLNLLDFDKEEFFENSINQSIRNMKSTYIPAERILFSLIGNSLSGLWANNVALPDCYKEFAAKYEVSRKEVRHNSYKDFNIDYNFNNGLDEIVINSTKILLSEASSGVQSIIPLLLVLDFDVKKYEGEYNKTLIIEEPELNLFPIKQKKLVSQIINKVNHKSHKLIFTTHSPYILSSLDTLILAKNVFDEYPHLKNEINKIIPEEEWLDYKDISVYEVRNDGKIISIKNDEYKSIDANVIDGVSDIISEEFDKLTELRYAHGQ